MPLYGTFTINDGLLSGLYIARQEKLKGEDQEHEYEWALVNYQTGETVRGHVRHRYNDRHVVLIQKVLSAYLEVTDGKVLASPGHVPRNNGS